MKKKEWEKIAWARELLGLEKRATLAEIKKAFRTQIKKHHPDVSEENPQTNAKVLQITEAYDLLLAYCASYRYNLAPKKHEATDPEDWWLERFGCDPLWGKGSD